MAAMGVAPTARAEDEGTAVAPDVLDTSAAGPAAIRGGAIRIVAFAAGTVFGVTSGALLYRHLGVVDTGRYSLAISLVAIVAGRLGLRADGRWRARDVG